MSHYKDKKRQPMQYNDELVVGKEGEVLGKRGQFSKTKMCKFQLMGICTKGASCVFAHDAGELKVLPNLARTKLCEELIQTGHCTRPNCSYAHSKDELRATPGFLKTKLCKFFQDGHCALAENCRYAHSEQELRSQDIRDGGRSSDVSCLVTGSTTSAEGRDTITEFCSEVGVRQSSRTSRRGGKKKTRKSKKKKDEDEHVGDPKSSSGTTNGGSSGGIIASGDTKNSALMKSEIDKELLSGIKIDAAAAGGGGGPNTKGENFGRGGNDRLGAISSGRNNYNAFGRNNHNDRKPYGNRSSKRNPQGYGTGQIQDGPSEKGNGARIGDQVMMDSLGVSREYGNHRYQPNLSYQSQPSYTPTFGMANGHMQALSAGPVFPTRLGVQSYAQHFNVNQAAVDALRQSRCSDNLFNPGAGGLGAIGLGRVIDLNESGAYLSNNPVLDSRGQMIVDRSFVAFLPPSRDPVVNENSGFQQPSSWTLSNTHREVHPQKEVRPFNTPALNTGIVGGRVPQHGAVKEHRSERAKAFVQQSLAEHGVDLTPDPHGFLATYQNYLLDPYQYDSVVRGEPINRVGFAPDNNRRPTARPGFSSLKKNAHCTDILGPDTFQKAKEADYSEGLLKKKPTTSRLPDELGKDNAATSSSPDYQGDKRTGDAKRGSPSNVRTPPSVRTPPRGRQGSEPRSTPSSGKKEYGIMDRNKKEGTKESDSGRKERDGKESDADKKSKKNRPSHPSQPTDDSIKTSSKTLQDLHSVELPQQNILGRTCGKTYSHPRTVITSMEHRRLSATDRYSYGDLISDPMTTIGKPDFKPRQHYSTGQLSHLHNGHPSDESLTSKLDYIVNPDGRLETMAHGMGGRVQTMGELTRRDRELKPGMGIMGSREFVPEMEYTGGGLRPLSSSAKNSSADLTNHLSRHETRSSDLSYGLPQNKYSCPAKMAHHSYCEGAYRDYYHNASRRTLFCNASSPEVLAGYETWTLEGVDKHSDDVQGSGERGEFRARRSGERGELHASPLKSERLVSKSHQEFEYYTKEAEKPCEYSGGFTCYTDMVPSQSSPHLHHSGTATTDTGRSGSFSSSAGEPGYALVSASRTNDSGYTEKYPRTRHGEASKYLEYPPCGDAVISSRETLGDLRDYGKPVSSGEYPRAGKHYNSSHPEMVPKHHESIIAADYLPIGSSCGNICMMMRGEPSSRRMLAASRSSNNIANMAVAPGAGEHSRSMVEHSRSMVDIPESSRSMASMMLQREMLPRQSHSAHDLVSRPYHPIDFRSREFHSQEFPRVASEEFTDASPGFGEEETFGFCHDIDIRVDANGDHQVRQSRAC